MPDTGTQTLALFFENTITEEAIVVPIPAGPGDYHASLPPGTYHLYTWLPDLSVRGIYSTCPNTKDCQEHTLQPFEVTACTETTGVNIVYWHAPANPPIALVGRVMDGTGAEPLADGVVLIQDSRIVAVGPSTEIDIPAGATVLAMDDATILPGLINTHVHNAYLPANLRTWLREGVTTVRDLGAPLGSGYFARRDDLRADPNYARLVSAGPIVTAPGGYPTTRIACLTIDSPEGARREIAQILADGADVIKIALESGGGPTLSTAAIEAIVETAHASGIPVTAHVTKSDDLERALACGVDDMAHMVTDRASRSTIRQMVKDGTYWTPTLVALGGEGASNLRRFVAAGGKVALGTDAGYLAGLRIGLPMAEMSAMQEAGMTPMQILVAATRNAAEVCRLDGILGTIEVGKLADLLVIEGNPLHNLKALENVRIVIHGGTIVRHDSAELEMAEEGQVDEDTSR
jgi:imidazolonepropionase-like amidohydrolase